MLSTHGGGEMEDGFFLVVRRRAAHLLPKRGGVAAEIHYAETLAFGGESLGECRPVDFPVRFGKVIIHAPKGFEELRRFGSNRTHLLRREAVRQLRTLAEGRLCSRTEHEA